MGKIKAVFHLLPRPLRTKKALIITVALLFAIWFLTRGSANVGLIKYHTVTEKTVRSEITGSGKIKAKNSIVLRFPVGGKITHLPVERGDTVTTGQVVASIDRERYDISLRQAEWDFQAAKAEFDKVYDQAKGRTAETFDERIERTAIDAKHNKAYDALLKARRDLRDTVILAPFTGKVESVSVQMYEEILPTTNVAKLVGNDALDFEAEIDESEIGKVSEGQRAVIILDAYPNEEIPVTVASIGDESIQTSTGGTAFVVTFVVPDGSGYRSGMSGEVRILVDEVSGAAVVPFEAVVDETYVHVKAQAKVEKVKISQGISSDTEVEVRSGLKTGDQVVISGFEELEKKSLLQKLLRM